MNICSVLCYSKACEGHLNIKSQSIFLFLEELLTLLRRQDSHYKKYLENNNKINK